MSEMFDTEQIKRDTDMLADELRAIANGSPTSLNAGEADRFAAVMDALLAALEQAERERESYRANSVANLPDLLRRVEDYEARLAKVPALVAVLKGIASYERLPEWMRDKANEALADYEGE